MVESCLTLDELDIRHCRLSYESCCRLAEVPTTLLLADYGTSPISHCDSILGSAHYWAVQAAERKNEGIEAEARKSEIQDDRSSMLMSKGSEIAKGEQ